MTDANSPRPTVTIGNWFSGVRLADTQLDHSVSGTAHIDALLEDEGLLYVAPEAGRDGQSTDATPDVFSLGAIAYRLKNSPRC